MDSALIGRLARIASAPRLHRYRQAATSDLEAVMLYGWNIQLAEALLPSLALLEVTLRNAVHRTLTAHAGTDFWFEAVLHPAKYENIAELVDRITKRQGSSPSAGKIISEITFGFWPLLFAKRYNSLWWDPPKPLLARILQNHPNVARDTRALFERRLEYVVALRNRVVHHEAIFQGGAAPNRPVLPIDTLHAQIVEMIGWIDADAARLARCLDRFDAVFAPTGRTGLDAMIVSAFTVPPDR